MKPQEICAAFIVSNYSKNARRFTQGPHKNMKKGDQLFYSNNVNFCVKTLHFILAKYARILTFLLKSLSIDGCVPFFKSITNAHSNNFIGVGNENKI